MSLSLKPTLARLAIGATLTREEAADAFGIIMDGDATQAQIGGLLMAMRTRGETTEELTGAVAAMRARMTRIEAPPDAIDVCGTGGDGAASLNISTANALVTAACGIPVAKHGNRALSSRAGGADVLLALGVDIEPPMERLSAILREAGCVFLFAPRHHPAMRHAGPARAELGVRTIFNLLGPLSNPAGVRRQLIGVYDAAWSRPIAETLRDLGTEIAWIYHSQGLDELTLAGPSHITALNHGKITAFTLNPSDAGLPGYPVDAIRGGDAVENAAAITALLAGERSAFRDTILFNAAAALIVAGATASLIRGVAMAAEAIDTGRAAAVLEKLISRSQITA